MKQGEWPIHLDHVIEQVARHSRFRKSLSALLLLASLASCGTMNVAPCSGDGQLALQEMLYFGTETPSGHVMPEDWAQFLSEIVTPRFPDGLSAWHASGQWRSASGEVIREPSYVLSLVHPDDAASNNSVQEIITFYKTRFQQEAVLRVKTAACTTL